MRGAWRSRHDGGHGRRAARADSGFGAGAAEYPRVRTRGREQKFSLDYAEDDSNQRVWNVLNRDPVFEDLAFHPVALDYVKALLGWPALLGNFSANIAGPGGDERILHADQASVPEP